MTPPRALVRELAAYDADLRVRWGAHAEQWYVEKRMPPRSVQYERERPTHGHVYADPRMRDLYDGWREGYVLVLIVPPGMVARTSAIMDEVRRCDLRTSGSVKAFIAEIEAQDEAAEAEQDREIATWSQAAASDAYDRIQWLSGNRVAVTPPPDRPQDFTVARDGYVVRDRRQVGANV